MINPNMTATIHCHAFYGHKSVRMLIHVSGVTLTKPKVRRLEPRAQRAGTIPTLLW